ncbi:MAG: ROK family protein [Acidimicrobiia bacterium]
MTAPVVGIDLGGTKIFGALVDPDRTGAEAVLADAKVSTPTGGVDDVLDAVEAMVRSLSPSPIAVGVGTPGVVEPGTGRVLVAPNVAGFDRPVAVADLLRARLGCAVAVGNDVNVAALGEVRAGAAVGQADVLAVWMGTGLGAALVLDGRLRTGPHGLAGELGHAVAVPGGRRCGCGGYGHVEAYIGRRALELHARQLHAEGRRTLLVELAGERPMKSKVFRTAYDAGDPVARELIDEGIERLATAVVNVAVTVDVGAVVIGGGLGERFRPLVRERVVEALRMLGHAGIEPVVLEAALGDHAGALGAAWLVEDQR